VYKYHYTILRNLLVPLYKALFIFGTTSNVIIIIIIICNENMRTFPNMYILNLAISDLICLVVLFLEAYSHVRPFIPKNIYFTYTFVLFFRRLSVGLSAYSVAVLSIQQYNLTVIPFHIRVSSQPMWRVTVAIICEVWIVAAFFAIPSTISTLSYYD
jgi:hypothetical protein